MEEKWSGLFLRKKMENGYLESGIRPKVTSKYVPLDSISLQSVLSGISGAVLLMKQKQT